MRTLSPSNIFHEYRRTMDSSAIDRNVGFPARPSTGGTTSLVWHCFVTIFLCTWTVQRPNIPVPQISQRPVISVADVIENKVCWMSVTLVCPEYVALVSYYKWKDAKRLTTNLRIYGWRSSVHGFYTEKGGHAARLNSNPRFQASESGHVVELQDGIAYKTRSGDLRTMANEEIITAWRSS